MARITIVGSGILGMSIAWTLSRNHDVTIIAKDLPGDERTIGWASPWAGVSFIAGGCDNRREMQMQLDAFAELRRLSIRYPECSVKHMTINEVFDEVKTTEDIWWKDHVPEFRFLASSELPKGTKSGITYKTVVLNPDIFLPWLKSRLETMGVQFKRMHLTALSDARFLGHDVLVNATGFGSKFLKDVQDEDVQLVRGQTLLVKNTYSQMFSRDDSSGYTYAIPRGDGTVILGGCRDSTGRSTPDPAMIKDILRRLNENLPNVFSANPQDYEVIRHNVGMRPCRTSGIRVERDAINGQQIVHAYGFALGGYIYSFGAAREACKLIEDILYPSLSARL